MAGWDTDEEEKLEFSDETDEKGHDDYMIVIHYPQLSPLQFIPQHQVRDDKGRPVISPWGKNQPKLEDGDPQSVGRKKTESWKTKGDVLNQMDAAQKSICNCVKALLNKGEVSVFYHNAPKDDCARYRGKHLHILWHSPLTAKGGPKALWNTTAWKTLQKKCKENGGYARAQAVKMLPNALAHFMQAPRKYMGTNCAAYHALYKEVSANGVATTARPLKECLEPEQEDEDSDGEREWDGFEPAPQAKKRAASGFEDDVEFVIPAEKKAKYVVEETKSDQLTRVVKMLCVRWNAYSMADLFKVMGMYMDDDGDELRYKNLWTKICGKPRLSGIVSNVKSMLQAEFIHKSFAELIDIYCKMPEFRQTYETPEDSYDIMLAWLQHQRINPLDFVQKVIAVMDRKPMKINSILLVGESNSGKTVCFSQPLRTLARFVGMIGNRGSNSDFVYMECINQRMIAVDECVMNPQNLEDFKLLMGGEPLKANVKGKGYETVERTPVILTGNKEPWCLDNTQREPFLNRMYYWNVTKCDELADKKFLSPKMWWYLMQLPGLFPFQNGRLPTIADLVPRPGVEETVTEVDEQSPL